MAVTVGKTLDDLFDQRHQVGGRAALGADLHRPTGISLDSVDFDVGLGYGLRHRPFLVLRIEQTWNPPTDRSRLMWQEQAVRARNVPHRGAIFASDKRREPGKKPLPA